MGFTFGKISWNPVLHPIETFTLPLLQGTRVIPQGHTRFVHFDLDSHFVPLRKGQNVNLDGAFGDFLRITDMTHR